MTPFEDGGFRRTMHLDMAVRCKEPYRFTLYAKHSAWARRKLAPFTITGASQCRRCENCGRSRAMRWSGRAIDEYNAWPRTVFGTFTLSPDEHYLLDARIQAGERDVDGRWSRHPVNLGLLNESQLFTARAREFGRELTKYLKRVRESRKAPLRYLMIAEAHDSERTSVEMRMRPHFHVLIHECQAGTVFLGDPHHAWTEGLDLKDLFNYGDQFNNYATPASGNSGVPFMELPLADGTRRYAAATEIMALFSDTTNGRFRQDGVVSLGILGRQRQTQPGLTLGAD